MIVADFIKMKDIYHNIKIFMLITLISAIWINLGMRGDFFWVSLALIFFFNYFTEWKIKKITNTKEGKYFLILTFPLGLLFSFFIEKETIFNIPKEDIGFIIAALVSVIILTITEYANKSKENKTN